MLQRKMPSVRAREAPVLYLTQVPETFAIRQEWTNARIGNAALVCERKVTDGKVTAFRDMHVHLPLRLKLLILADRSYAFS